MTESYETSGTAPLATVPTTTQTNTTTPTVVKAPRVPAPAVSFLPNTFKSPMNLFLTINPSTAPGFGHEADMYGDLLASLGFWEDSIGNFWGEMGTGSTTLFAAHMDTADYQNPKKINMFYTQDGDHIVTDGTTILGADDRAGMTVLLWLWHHKVPGFYAFFIGEESGCTGSRAAAEDWEDEIKRRGTTDQNRIKRMVCFDRKGTTSIITSQISGVCCSQSFALALGAEFERCGVAGLRPDPTGTVTDSNSFAHLIPECTNLSIGYENAHSHSERLNWRHLDAMCRAAVRVDWESLPTDRDPTVVVRRTYGNYNTYGASYYGHGASGVYGDGWGDGEVAWDGKLSQATFPAAEADTKGEASSPKAPADEDAIASDTDKVFLVDPPYDEIYTYKDEESPSELDVAKWIEKHPAAAAVLLHDIISEFPDVLESYGRWVRVNNA